MHQQQHTNLWNAFEMEKLWLKVDYLHKIYYNSIFCNTNKKAGYFWGERGIILFFSLYFIWSLDEWKSCGFFVQIYVPHGYFGGVKTKRYQWGSFWKTHSCKKFPNWTRREIFWLPMQIQLQSPTLLQARTKAPSTLIRFQTKTELFCSGYGYRPHYNAENNHRKRSHSKTLSRVERFENDAFWKRCFLVWTEKTMLSENGDVIKIDTTRCQTTWLWVSKMADRRYHVASILIGVVVWTGENDT